MSNLFNFQNTYANLPSPFHTKCEPTPVRAPRVVLFNEALADELGIEIPKGDEACSALFSGNQLPEGAQLLAQAYAGHQFGGFAMLGDGRAHLLGEHVTPRGERVDIQFKGSGPTPYSRHGDGRAALGPMLREYIISEALHALNIPTTRSLAVVASGEPVMRETMLQGAILTRVASSHIRVGTFEYAAAREDIEGLKALTEYTIARHYPEASEADSPALALLQNVMQHQAELIAKWMSVGFVHGVMNTDNMTLSGETIDYGPCAFMEAYDPATVFSSIDEYGRYACGNQPPIAQWNLARFAESLLPLLHENIEKAIAIAEDTIHRFRPLYEAEYLKVMRNKLGMKGAQEDDLTLIQGLLDWMKADQHDFTNSFRALSNEAAINSPVFEGETFRAWHAQWKNRLEGQDISHKEAATLMRAHNPAIIPRNHKVEEALSAAQDGDIAPTKHLLNALSCPYEEHAEYAEYFSTAPSNGLPYQTFCGT